MDRKAFTAAASGGQLFAKTIVLGDVGTGRSSLIAQLLTDSDIGAGAAQDDFYISVQLTAEELANDEPVMLKLWEYADNLSKKDEALAFQGALFVVVTFDICRAESFRAVFDQWVPLKDQLSPDSFLFVVGTHFDRAHSRQVEVPDACKACAKKDAMYLELSTATGQNVPLFRRLLCKRVQYILERKKELAVMGDTFLQNPLVAETKPASPSGTEEAKPQKNEHSGHRASFHAPQPDLSIPLLEPNIMSDSVGAILASCYGLPTWQRFEEHEAELQQTGQKIEAFIQELANVSDNVNNPAELHALVASYSEDMLRDMPQSLEGFDLAAWEEPPTEDLYDLQAHYREISDAFKILGMAVPKSLLVNGAPLEPQPDLPTSLPEDFLTASPNRPNLRKMLVRLPSGPVADMVLDLEGNMEQQIELFLLSHSLAHDDDARKKLVATTTKVQRDYLEASRPRSASSRTSSVAHSSTPANR